MQMVLLAKKKKWQDQKIHDIFKEGRITDYERKEPIHENKHNNRSGQTLILETDNAEEITIGETDTHIYSGVLINNKYE